ncbi:RING-H2 finger protein ATL66-like [Andrographis paniculata]|uniref:RING-H2 finger protein ATL66-like n=1 Tax=Andrographis paniculata TaxID=175694 RepID=UPI0021E9710C|nr:RING-H2 finger protein ATL66-like [Andrographis paniculata]
MSYQQEPTTPFRWHYAEFDDSNFQIRGRTLFFIIVLFSVILVVALLFLYARWVCRSGHSSPAPAPAPQGLSLSTAQLAGAGGLDPATINSFPIVLHKLGSSGGADAECCICLGVFADGDKVKVLPQCNHRFHSDCVDKWLAAQPSCPLCRAELRADSLV